MRIVVAMSGGVDSSVAAALLAEQGHDVIGLSMQLYPSTGSGQAASADERFGGCCTLDDLNDARRVAAAIGFPHYIVNFERQFRETVISNFVQEYASGRTPLPCAHCNSDLKFSTLLDRARGLGAEHVATGHYARVDRTAGGRWLLKRSADPDKDQSYFLFPLTQDQLARAVFPVGGLAKPEVRAGAIVDEKGRQLGTHGGIHRFTVGQRKGLGIASTIPLYVLKIDSDAGTVMVGARDALEQTRLTASGVNWISIDSPQSPTRVAAQIRHRHRPAAGTVRTLPGGGAEMIFDQPQPAITPGQAVVFYDGDLVVGGGW